MLDLFAFLTLVAEPEASSRVAADLSAGYLAVTKGLGDDHVLVDAPICHQTPTESLRVGQRPIPHSEYELVNIPSSGFESVSKSLMASMEPKKSLPKLGIGGNKFWKLKKGWWNRDRMLLLQRE